MKKSKFIGSLVLSLTLLLTSLTPAFATETQTDSTQTAAVEEGANSDAVTIETEDKPFLSLGADLSADQQHTVLSLMGIDAANLDQYDVVYVNNEEEHQYLDAYVPSEKIGSHSLSSVVICQTEEGSGIEISTYNINYCTVGMYKNALATAGITDAKIIVAGPFEISGTAALVGTFKAYEEMTGEELDQSVMDGALDELCTTGELEEGLSDDDAQKLEAMVAELKQMMADGQLETEEDIKAAIQEEMDKYGLTLTEDQIQELTELLQKLQGLDLNWDAIEDQAQVWSDTLSDVLADVDTSSIGDKIVEFFQKLWDTITSWFN